MNENNKKLGKNCPYCGSKLKRKIAYCANCGRFIGKNNVEKFEDFYINNRRYKYDLAFISFFTTPFIILFIVMSIINPSFDVFLLLLPIFSCLFLVLLVRLSSRKVKIYLSYNNFKVLIGNNLFFRINWEDIKEITIIEELYEHKVKATKYTPSKIKVYTGYKLEFIDSIKNETIRLWCCRFSQKQQNKIINKLEHFSIVEGKKLNTIKSSGKIIKLYNARQKCSEIQYLMEKFH